MRGKKIVLLFLAVISLGYSGNPIITSIYTADPSGHVFNDTMYLYPSHDRSDATWWDMTDWHVFSSTNLVDWTDHGVALSLANIPGAQNYAWAPDAGYKNGTYYFYFPYALGNYTGNTNTIGVATGTSPIGPFTSYSTPVVTGYPQSFDPCCFIDDDGTAYLLCGQGSPNIAKLSADMLSLAEPLKSISGATSFFEGSWMHKFNGKYYLSYSTGSTIAYAMGASPYGPFIYKGIVLANQPYAANTTHHSIVKYGNQWYLFWHNKKLSTLNGESSDYKRSVCLDLLTYNADGTINQVSGSDAGVPPVGITSTKAGIMPGKRGAISSLSYEVYTLNGSKLGVLDSRQSGNADTFRRSNFIHKGVYLLKSAGMAQPQMQLQ